MQLVGLLDCNNFFVSCERLFRPDLRQRPVVVLSGNDGCIVARSNEVKDLGVPMGVPYFQVADTLQAAQAVSFSSNFTLYRDISRRVMTSLRELVDTMETYSIDESFFTLSAEDYDDALTQLTQIKTTIEQRVGVPVSVGAAKNKTIAKHASAQEKRGTGVCVLIGEDWERTRAEMPVGSVWGIGRRLAARLEAQQLRTVADFVASDRSRVAKLFGVAGCRLYDELSEQVVWPVGSVERNTQKSIMSTRSFKNTTTDVSVVQDAVSYHVHHAARELRARGLGCRYLQVMARPSRHGDWVLHGGSRECVLPAPTSDTRVLLREAQALCSQLYEPGVPYKKAGVVLGWLSDGTLDQPDLFASGSGAPAADPLMQTIDSINRRFGRDIVSIGRTDGAVAWAPARDHLSPRYTTNWDDLASVTA